MEFASWIAKILAVSPFGCGTVMVIRLRGEFLRLWRDSRGSSLIEYSFLITIMIALVVIGVAVAGVWVFNMWVHLLASLSP